MWANESGSPASREELAALVDATCLGLPADQRTLLIDESAGFCSLRRDLNRSTEQVLDRGVSAPESCPEAPIIRPPGCSLLSGGAGLQTSEPPRGLRRHGADSNGWRSAGELRLPIHPRPETVHVDLGSWHDIVLLGGAVLVTVVICSLEDSSVSPTHGQQEGSAWNGHFGCTCYHPLFVFNQFGDLERCCLAARQRPQRRRLALGAGAGDRPLPRARPRRSTSAATRRSPSPSCTSCWKLRVSATPSACRPMRSCRSGSATC